MKSFLLKREKTSFFSHFILLAAFYLKREHLQAKVSRATILWHLIRYFLGYYIDKLRRVFIWNLNLIRETLWFLTARKLSYKLLPAYRKRLLSVALPENIQQKDKKLFQKRDHYLLPDLRLRKLQNVFVYLDAYHGIVLKNQCIDKKSVHGNWIIRLRDVHEDYYRKTVEALFRAKYSKESNPVILPVGQKYLLVHHWFNYYHWITETLERIWRIKPEEQRQFSLLLPADFQEIAFVQATLQPLQFKSITYIPRGEHVLADELYLVDNKRYSDHYSPDRIQRIGNFYRNYFGKERSGAERIFISRRKTARRRIVNEDTIIPILEKYDFKIICTEDYSFEEQVSVFSLAKYLVAMHGAGLTNMAFMQKGAKIFELHREVSSFKDLHSRVYINLASALDHRYYYQFCQPVDVGEDFFKSDLIVDPVVFEKNLTMMLSR